MTVTFAKAMTPEAAALLRECRNRLGRPEAYCLAARMGFSQADTAQALGVSRQAVEQWGAENGVTFRLALRKVAATVRAELLKGLPDNCVTIAEAAAALGASHQVASIAARRAGVKMKRQPRPSPRGDEIARLAAQGMTVGEVAHVLGIRQATVSQLKKRYGINFLRDGRRA